MSLDQIGDDQPTHWLTVFKAQEKLNQVLTLKIKNQEEITLSDIIPEMFAIFMVAEKRSQFQKR